jgi:hypothetical protein
MTPCAWCGEREAAGTEYGHPICTHCATLDTSTAIGEIVGQQGIVDAEIISSAMFSTLEID